MNDDFEVNDTGTINALNLHTMALRAALEYIDACRATNYSGARCVEAIALGEVTDYVRTAKIVAREFAACDTLETLRKELGPEFQENDSET